MNNSENPHEELMPELKDLLNRIKAYNTSHPQGCFIFSFVGYEKDTDNFCEDCGGYCDKISDKHTISGMHGDIWTLRDMLNVLRDMAEEDVGEEGFVSF